MVDMEYVPNPTFQTESEEVSPNSGTIVTNSEDEDGRPKLLTVKDKSGSRKSDRSPSPRTTPGEKRNRSWYYSSMYPSYKTRRKDFESLFSCVGVEGRFVVDYSCAYHKDILHQGRMYVTTNTCCFYSYIFGWENKVVVDWKEVSSITKEKTAFFIPNAIQITAGSTKYFFASFVERDASYMMLFRLWQAALANQLLSDEDIDQIIACEYGEGEENDDDDEEVDDDDAGSECLDSVKEDEIDGGCPAPVSPSQTLTSTPEDVEPIFTSWMSRTCEGTTVCDQTFPHSLDQLYKLLYSNDNFYFNFQKERGTTELDIGDWEQVGSGTKVREVSYNMALNNPVGPKKCQVKETQTLSPDNVENQIYCIETTADNSGVPYADSFSVVTHSCLMNTGNNTARLVARAEIRFKKDLWGFLKDKIETNAWSGIKSYYTSLSLALDTYSEHTPQQASMKTQKMRGNRRTTKSTNTRLTVTSLIWNILTQPLLLYLVMMFLLVTSAINTTVLYRLAHLSPPSPPQPPSFPPLPKLPTDQSGWLELLRKQAEQHSLRSSYLRQQLLIATEHIARAEVALEAVREGLEEWEPFDWVGEDVGCFIKDNKLHCDKKIRQVNKDAEAKDEI